MGTLIGWLLVFLPLLLVALNSLDKDVVDKFRSQIINYWLDVQELTVGEQVRQILVKLRSYLRRRQYIFLLSYVAAVVLVFASITITTYREDRKVAISSFVKLVAVAAGLQREEALSRRIEPIEIGESCYVQVNSRALEASALLDAAFAWETGIEKYIDQRERDRYGYFFMLNVLANGAICLLLGAIYFISLVISINITQVLVLRYSLSKVKIWMILFVDAITAFTIPVFVSCLILYIVSKFVPLTRETIELGAKITDWRIFSLSVTAGLFPIHVSIFFQNIIESVFSLFGVFSSVFGAVIGLALWQMTNSIQFVRDIIRALKGDILGIDFVSALFNWSVVIDIIYSLSFILPTAFIVSVSRVKFFRMLVSNFLQRVAENKDGPFTNIIALATSALALLQKLF